MAVRELDRTNDELRFTGVPSFTGALTIAAVIKRITVSGTDYYLIAGHHTSAGAIAISFEFATSAFGDPANSVYFDTGGTGRTSGATNTVVAADGWVLVVVTKAAGTATPRFHIFKAGAWVHVNGGGTVTNAASQTGGTLRIGTFGSGATDRLGSRLAVEAGWSAAMTDLQVEALAGSNKAGWQANGVGAPAYLLEFNQAAITDAVTDAQGALTQSARVETTVVTGDDPPSTIYTLSGGTSVVGGSLAQPSAVFAFRAASLTQPATVRSVVGGSLAQSATVTATSVVGGSLAQPAVLAGIIGASVAQPATVRSVVGGSLAQPASVGQVTVGGSLRQRSRVFRTLVQIGPGLTEASVRGVIRTTAGRVYAFVADDTAQKSGTGPGVIRAYKSGQTGHAITTFAEVDGTHRPAAATTGRILSGPDCRYDPATGIVHVVYHDNSGGQTSAALLYRQFDTGADTWGSAETVSSTSFGTPTSSPTGYLRGFVNHGLELDATGVPHVVYAASTTTVAHRSRAGGTWSSATNISTGETNPTHQQVAIDASGDLHAIWYHAPTNRAIRYCKRTSGTWGTVENAATNTGDTDGVTDMGNLDQCGSLALMADGRPAVMYLSNQGGGGGDDNTGNLAKIKIRSAAGTWSHDDPTRTSLGGLHCHTPMISTQGDDLYCFIGHGDAPNIYPGYADKPSGGSWTGGSTGQVLAGGTGIGNSALYDGSAYVSGTRTSKGTTGSAAATLDGSASVRWASLAKYEVDPSVIDVLFMDEDSDGSGHPIAYYNLAPTPLTTVGASLAQPSSLTGVAGTSLVQPATVRALVGGSLAQPVTVRTVVGASLAQPAATRTVVGASLGQPATLRTVHGASLGQPAVLAGIVGASLVQPVTIRALVGGSLAQPATVQAVTGASLAQPATVRTLKGGSLVTPAALAGIVGASLAQPASIASSLSTVGTSLLQLATVRTLRAGSLAQPATVRTTLGGSLAQPGRVLVAVGGSAAQPAIVLVVRGGALDQRAQLRALIAASLMQRAGVAGVVGGSLAQGAHVGYIPVTFPPINGGGRASSSSSGYAAAGSAGTLSDRGVSIGG